MYPFRFLFEKILHIFGCVIDLCFSGDSEVRGVKRKVLLEELAGELPNGTIRFSSKVVFIDESGYFKLVHLADGTVIKTKVTSM